MSVYETPKSEGVEQKKRVDLGCGVNCDWGFGAGIAIATVFVWISLGDKMAAGVRRRDEMFQIRKNAN